jgi:hypothetical protein
MVILLLFVNKIFVLFPGLKYQFVLKMLDFFKALSAVWIDSSFGTE